MAYALLLLAISIILGAIGHANHLELLAELATIGLLIAIIALAHNAWTWLRGRRSPDQLDT